MWQLAPPATSTRSQIASWSSARVELLMDYSEVFTIRDIPFPDGQREYATMLDCIEDACLGLYRRLAGE